MPRVNMPLALRSLQWRHALVAAVGSALASQGVDLFDLLCEAVGELGQILHTELKRLLSAGIGLKIVTLLFRGLVSGHHRLAHVDVATSNVGLAAPFHPFFDLNSRIRLVTHFRVRTLILAPVIFIDQVLILYDLMFALRMLEAARMPIGGPLHSGVLVCVVLLPLVGDLVGCYRLDLCQSWPTDSLRVDFFVETAVGCVSVASGLICQLGHAPRRLWPLLPRRAARAVLILTSVHLHLVLVLFKIRPLLAHLYL